MEDKKYDPLNILPYEIWVKCIQIYACNQPEGPLPLLPVSLCWQKHLLGEPKLWTTIYLDGGHDEQCRVECFFHLSRRISIEKGIAVIKSLAVDLVLDRDSGATEAIKRHSDRIKSLTFVTKSIHRYSNHHIAIFSQALSACKYPNLTHIHVEPPRFAAVIPRSLLEVCPALIGVYGAYVQQENLAFLPPSTIRIGISGSGVLGKGTANHLEMLRIRCSASQQDDIRYNDYFTVSTTQLKFFELEFGEHLHVLPKQGARAKGLLTRSPLTGRPLPLTKTPHHLLPVQAFISSSHDSLTALSLKMLWYEVSILAHCLSVCRSLRELYLILHYSPTECHPWNVPPLTVDDIGQVRKLYLSLPIVKSSVESVQKRIAKNLALVIRLFAENDALQYLEELRLSLPDKETKQDVLNLLRGARNLKELYWTGVKPPANQSFEKVLLTKLHTLVIQYGGDLQLLNAPNLICLECHVDLPRFKGIEGSLSSHLPSIWARTLESISTPTFFLHRWNDLLLSENANDSPFSRVVVARFTMGPIDYRPMFPLIFINLRTVIFDGRANHTAVGFMREITGDSVLNHFMLEMLISPNMCPQLQTIRSTLFPNWALAVALFHRRNTIEDVSPITSLWLHGQPHTRILELVMRALRPGGGDAEGIVAAIAVDKILHRRWEVKFFRNQACQDCIMSGYVSCTPVAALNPAAPAFTQPTPPDDYTITELLDLYPPASDVALPVLYTREIWEAHLKKTIIAVGEPDTPRCKRHGRRSIEHIGPHTLDGVSYDAF